MNLDQVAAIADSVLSPHPTGDGALYPPACADAPSAMQTECLARGTAAAAVSARIRFLHPLPGRGTAPCEAAAPDGLTLGRLARARVRAALALPSPLAGTVELSAQPLGADVWRLTVRVANTTPARAAECRSRADARPLAFLGPHVVLAIAGGEFLSLANPPEALRRQAAECENYGTWPALAGDGDLVLSLPVRLPDHAVGPAA